MFISLEDIDRRPSRHLLDTILHESVNHNASSRQVAMLVNDTAFYNLCAQQYRAVVSLRRGHFSNRLFNTFVGLEDLIQKLPIVVESDVRSGATCAAAAVVFHDIANGGR